MERRKIYQRGDADGKKEARSGGAAGGKEKAGEQIEGAANGKEKDREKLLMESIKQVTVSWYWKVES
jgi:hypothetical protein